MSSVAAAILTGLLMGVVFGFALEKSRVFEPGIIVGQMQLRNFIMLKVFLTAVATGALVLAVLNGFGFVKLQPKAALYAADVVGGVLLGAGIALAGACPGTTLAQIGIGYRDAWFTLAGGLLGAVAFSYAQPWLDKTLIGTGPKLMLHRSPEHPLLAGRDRLWPRPSSSFSSLMERLRPWRDDLGTDNDGTSAGRREHPTAGWLRPNKR